MSVKANSKFHDSFEHCILLFIASVYLYLLTDGSFNLIASEPFSRAYDDLSRSLLRLSAEVKLDSIGGEAFIVNKKVYMYFGPFPALIRLLLNSINNDYYGLWGRLSCFIASIISLIGFSEILKYALSLNLSFDVRTKQVLYRLSLVGLGLATPVVFLISSAFIYHEASLWGLCFSIWSMYYLFKYLFQREEPLSCVFYISLFSGLALLSRVTFAFPYLAILLFVFIKLVISTMPDIYKIIKNTLLLFSPIILCISFQLWYNNERFNNPLVFFDYSKYSWRVKGFNKIINEKLFVNNFKNYFLVYDNYFQSKQPFIKMSMPKARTNYKGAIKGYKRFYHYWEPIIPISLTATWLLFLSLLSILYVFRFKFSLLNIFLFLAFFTQFSFIMCFGHLTYRYTADILPILLFFFFYLIPFLTEQSFSKEKIWFFQLLILFSIYSTIIIAM